MTGRAALAALAASLAAAPVAAQACPAPPPPGDGPARVVRYLADDALEGRFSGTPAERCAGDFLAAEFRRLGLAPGGDEGTYFQRFPLVSHAAPAAQGTGRNVVGVLRGTSRPGEIVVIGAHYDHLGMGGAFSLEPDARAVHNGADDNASGVAGMLHAAALLAARPPARTVVFVAFSGEELGLIGSSHFAGTMTADSVRAMLNLDMVGRLGSNPLIVYGVETAEEWRGLVDGAAAAQGVTANGSGDGYGASDHTAFYLKNLPVLHFFTNTHTDYHRPSDDWQKVDTLGVAKVGAIVADVARSVGDRPAALTFRRPAAPPPAAAGGGGYGAYLGSIPDFTPVAYGVKISGVRAGSPAEQAGLRAGDVLIAFDGNAMPDLQAMTDELRARKPGDRVRITVRRGEEEVVVTAVLGSRGG